MYRDSLCTYEVEGKTVIGVPDNAKDYPKNEIGKLVGALEVDQFYSQEFNRAENGFARSDISAFIHAESDEFKTVIAQRLNEVKAQYPDQNLSDEQLINLCVPRNVQSYHDMREWFGSIKDEGFEKAVKAAYDKVNPQPVPDPIVDPVKSVVVDPE